MVDDRSGANVCLSDPLIDVANHDARALAQSSALYLVSTRFDWNNEIGQHSGLRARKLRFA